MWTGYRRASHSRHTTDWFPGMSTIRLFLGHVDRNQWRETLPGLTYTDGTVSRGGHHHIRSIHAIHDYI